MDNKDYHYKDYYYELKYIDGDEVVTHKFPALINLEEMKGHLYRFLLASGWLPSTLNEGGFNE